ncbi:hypothetical protein BAE44_0025501 [Dichanthelium oligosanthes]|uniref:Flavodoxin-like domain-containing protein n=1 Tax=Dichanthelium oligosanthes TaxID=888268 RepID=A0A1E5UKU0_9POAL|nr:hypothetical protein BAE44_0025501 [Dichanthelium oligosanthes]
MGKGGGCVPSKKHQPPTAAPSSSSAAAAAAPREAPEEEATAAAVAAAPVGAVWKLRLYIVFYSMYGHMESLARRAAASAGAVEDVEAVLQRVPETLAPKVLEKMQAPAKDPAVPVITSAAELLEADGVLFGFRCPPLPATRRPALPRRARARARCRCARRRPAGERWGRAIEKLLSCSGCTERSRGALRYSNA